MITKNFETKASKKLRKTLKVGDTVTVFPNVKKEAAYSNYIPPLYAIEYFTSEKIGTVMYTNVPAVRENRFSNDEFVRVEFIGTPTHLGQEFARWEVELDYNDIVTL